MSTDAAVVVCGERGVWFVGSGASGWTRCRAGGVWLWTLAGSSDGLVGTRDVGVSHLFAAAWRHGALRLQPGGLNQLLDPLVMVGS